MTDAHENNQELRGHVHELGNALSILDARLGKLIRENPPMKDSSGIALLQDSVGRLKECLIRIRLSLDRT